MEENNNIQAILDYLNGTLSKEQRQAIDKRFEEDPSFGITFENVEIQQYLSGQLEKKSLKEFLTKLEQDPELEKKVEWHQAFQANLKQEGQRALKEEIKTIIPPLATHDNKTEEQPFIFRRPSRFLIRTIVAAALLAGVIFFTNWWFQQPSSSEALFASNFEPYEMKIGNRGEVEAMDLQKAITNYQEKKFDLASKNFDDLSKRDPSIKVYQLYAGCAFLANGETGKALEKFKELQGDFNFNDQAEWYLGLAYLKEKKLREAIDLFNNIAKNPDHSYHSSALQLKTSLKKLGQE